LILTSSDYRAQYRIKPFDQIVLRPRRRSDCAFSGKICSRAWTEFNNVRIILIRQFGSQATILMGMAYHTILLIAGALTCILLLTGRKPEVPPRKLRFVVIPLIATFLNYLYLETNRLPRTFTTNLCPPALQPTLIVAGLIFVIIGPIIALWGMMYLGRSFGVFVAVRKVVLRGPYRWVRHPMYLGWVTSYIGLALFSFSAAYWMLVTIHICLYIYRARMEESQLAEHSPVYREHMRRTGFLLPKFRRPPDNLISSTDF
jgi:protein-S-isoprenylcysteine O-methyltransferase Ste14